MWIQEQEEQERLMELWERYIRPLGKKPFNQFVKATRKPQNEFLARFIWPWLYVHPAGQPITEAKYVGIAATDKVLGRNHKFASEISNHGLSGLETCQRTLSYFTNTLTACDPVWSDKNQKWEWSPPKDRVDGEPPHCFTVEFDINETDFFRTQLGWLRSSKKPLDAPIGAVYRHFQQYRDFKGITVAWSGHKSLHIHVVFEPRLAVQAYGLNRHAMRDGLTEHWHDVARVVQEKLDIPKGIKADESLQFPEAFRRLPNGVRTIERTGKKGEPFDHLLGIPAGERVPQLCLWEHWRQQAADSSSNALFFRCDPFFREPQHASGRSGRGIGGSVMNGALSEDEVAYCAEQLRTLYSDYPKFAYLEYESGYWKARFYNSPTDGTPRSLIREDHNRLHMVGRDSDREPPEPLTLTLGAMMKLWLARFRNPPTAREQVEETVAVDVVRNRKLSAVERYFRRYAVDRESVARLTRKVILRSLPAHEALWITGPEGGGKSTGFFRVHHKLIARYGDDTRNSMYAVPEYVEAQKKADTFNEYQQQHGFHGVVLRSFEREYKETCKALGVNPFTITNALADGYATLLDLVKDRQPDVVDELMKRHRAFWREIGSRQPVWFTVHGVLEAWNTWSLTRMYWHRDFWSNDAEPAKLKFAMRLCLAVYDEVSAGSLLEFERSETLTWLDRMRQACPSWRKPKSSAVDRYREFTRYAEFNGAPVTFQEADTLARAGSRKGWEYVTVRDSREYHRQSGVRQTGADGADIYRAVDGNVWGVRQRAWWEGLADKVAVLTTEALPTLLATKVGGWHVVELECPKMRRDTVNVVFKRVSSASVERVISEFRDEIGKPNLFTISNKASEIPHTITHHSAKGTNGLMGRDLAQTMLHMSPAEYEQLEVLNAWAGVDVCCRLRHIDEFNQSAGRNLGFRQRDHRKHWLLISRELFLKIMALMAEYSRYDLRFELDKFTACNLTRKAA